MYRPEGFPKFSDDYVSTMPESFNTIFNWGADAMLEGLIRGTQCKVGEDYFELKLPRMRGVVVFIPEEKRC